MAIIGLLPAAISVGQDSQRETVSALIARSIFNGLSLSKPLLQTKSSSLPDSIDLQKDSKQTIGYDEHGRMVDNMEKAIFLADVQVLANTPSPDISRISVTLRTPPKAETRNQGNYTFVTYLDATDPFTSSTSTP